MIKTHQKAENVDLPNEFRCESDRVPDLILTKVVENQKMLQNFCGGDCQSKVRTLDLKET